MNRQIIRLVVPAFLALAAIAVACGPYFPNAYLIRGNEYHVLRIPGAGFFHELLRITDTRETPPPPGNIPRSEWGRTLAADCSDLSAELERKGMAQDERGRIVGEYLALRTMMLDIEHVEHTADLDQFQPLLDRIPLEFSLYILGAEAFHHDDLDEAIRYWTKLLDLPEEQRRYRSIWSAFMLGRSFKTRDPLKADAFYEQVSVLQQRGLVDSLALAPTALGERALIAWGAGDPVRAAHFYLEQFKTGGYIERSVSHASLHILCRAALTDGDPDPSALARDDLCRRILTAWVIAHPSSPETGTKWSAVLSSLGNDVKIADADRLAVASYSRNDIADARKWLTLSEESSPLSHWLRAKLLLREGKVDDAVKLLRTLTQSLPPRDEWNRPSLGSMPVRDVYGDLGVLHLGRREYEFALDAFLTAGYWQDAAYVAERILTLEELERYIERHQDDPRFNTTMRRPICSEEDDWDNTSIVDANETNLRYLLARRYARLGDWKNARRFYPSAEGNILLHVDDLLRCLNAGRDIGRTPRERAEHLFNAALVAKIWGMELMGTEDGPDWACYDGMFEHQPTKVVRHNDIKDSSLPETTRAALKASPDEINRSDRHAPRPDARFHYRYFAADLMWECSQLLPNDDEFTARALWTAGTWLKTLDPKAADRFYKALVRRCANLPIGREADKLRWFPKEFPSPAPPK
ncbi:MAG: hypothetical protein A2Z34_02790 [Planctomycetes bacterium RBG_16_59_8]|nr:MAG: hypothetical protein A2Z34_02790 [Planctomycetes bacterium RBG_16_59_8]